MSRFAAIADLLDSVDVDRVEISLDDIDAAVGMLPPSARKYPTWWSNSPSNKQASKGWLAAGFVCNGRAGDRIVFTRGAPALRRRAEGTAARKRPTHEAYGSSEPVSVRLDWLRAGEVTADAGGRLVMPAMPVEPGVYRFLATRAGSIDEVYIGESSSLRRRIGTNYRTPGASQSTSIRINAWLLNIIRDGWAVTLDYSLAGAVTIGEDAMPAPLAASWARRLAENAMLGIEHVRGDRVVINLKSAPE